MASKSKKDNDLITHPGTILEKKLEEVKMSQAELAERMGRPLKTINEIVKGRASITAETALQLESVLGTNADQWLNLEKEYRENLARQERDKILAEGVEWLKDIPHKALSQLGHIENSNDKEELLKNVLSFFGVASTKQWKKIWFEDGKGSVAFRISLARVPDNYAVASWLRIGELDAQKLKVPKFNPEIFKSQLNYLRTVAYEAPDDYLDIIKKACSKAGVKVVYTSPIKNDRVSGASRWFGNSPLIQLSDRNKAYDRFWFTFFHESGHILLHGKKDIFIENDKLNENGFNNKKKEEEANRFASNLLIPSKLYNEFKETKITDESIIEFAKMINMHKSIIVGRLQHDKLVKYNQYRNFKKALSFP